MRPEIPPPDALRREQFVAWFVDTYGADSAESRAKFMRTTGLSKGRVSQLFDKSQPFGEAAARSLRQRLGSKAGLVMPESGLGLSAPPPPPPPRRFDDRKQVSDTDWALLQAVKVAMTEDERTAVLKRHAELREQARLEYEAAKKKP